MRLKRVGPVARVLYAMKREVQLMLQSPEVIFFFKRGPPNGRKAMQRFRASDLMAKRRVRDRSRDDIRNGVRRGLDLAARLLVTSFCGEPKKSRLIDLWRHTGLLFEDAREM